MRLLQILVLFIIMVAMVIMVVGLLATVDWTRLDMVQIGVGTLLVAMTLLACTFICALIKYTYERP